MMNKLMTIDNFKKAFNTDFEIEINFKNCSFQYDINTEDLLDCLKDDDTIIIETVEFPTEEFMGYVKATYDNMDSLEWEHMGNEFFGYEFKKIIKSTPRK